MKEEELIKRLKSLDLPKADLGDHRRQLRAALLASGARRKPSRVGVMRATLSRMKARTEGFAAHWKSPQQVRRLAALGTAAVVLVVSVLLVIGHQSSTAQAADIARNSLEVKEALGGAEARVVRVEKKGSTSIVVLDSPGSGSRVVVSVDMSSKAVTSTTVVGTSTTSSSTPSSWRAVAGRLTDDGPDTVFLSADSTLYAVSNGRLLWSELFAGEPKAVINDVTGDGAKDVVISSGSFVRCYNGATGEKAWQFDCGQRRVFQQGLGWGGEDLDVYSIAVLGSPTAQIICAQTDYCVFGVEARYGEELWRFEVLDRVRIVATVPDMDGDGTGELFVGTYGGNIHLVKGETGKAEWKRRLGDQWVEYGELRHDWVEHIAILDDQRHGAVVSLNSGMVCLLDLTDGSVEWENQVAYPERSDTVGIWLAPDVTGDGLPEILVDKGYVSEAVETSTAPSGVTSVRRPLRIAALLSGADGSQVWETQLYLAGSATTQVDGQPALLELHTQAGIRVVSLKDGQPLKSLTVANLVGEASNIEPMSDGGYLLYSKDGNLVAVSPDGEVRWRYSRLTNIRVETGRFNTDGVSDLLVSGGATGADGIRQLSALDGITNKEIWSCDVTSGNVAPAGGLEGVQVVDDLTGDDIQDVLARGGSKIFRLSGADGSLASFDIGETITSLRPLKLGTDATGVLAGTDQGRVILDKDGHELWESAYTDWSDAEFGSVLVLNALNGDGISDLVLSFADRIVVARSLGASPLRFETHRSIAAGENKVIQLKELTNDIDGDGVQEIAYFEYDQDKSAASGVLLVVSPVTGNVWHRWNMPVTLDPACADFNGDGFRDSLVYHPGPKVPTEILTTASRRSFGQAKLEVYSGKDGSILWGFAFEADWWNAGSEKMPAAPIGDFTGDGVEDLAVSSVATLEGTGFSVSSTGEGSPHETYLRVYDIANNSLVKEVILPPAQKNSYIATGEGHYGNSPSVSGPGDALRLAGDLNGDGHRELAVLAGYLTGWRFAWAGHSVALVDVYGGQVLGYCSRLSTLDFFETGSANTMGFTDGSSVYLARMNSDLQVTWPSEGATLGSHARIAWEGAGDSSSASVFVDGYENAQSTGNEVTLPLKPGEHEVIVRSVDEYGVVTYAAVHFRVEQSPWASILASLSVAALLSLYFATRVSRVLRNRRARREGL